jgi:hypothetical protein
MAPLHAPPSEIRVKESHQRFNVAGDSGVVRLLYALTTESHTDLHHT